jgi:integrase
LGWRRHRSACKYDNDFVFCNTLGRGLDYRDVGEDFRTTVKRAGITTAGERLSLALPPTRLRLAVDLAGLNVDFVSRQLGHANPNVTLGVYAHLFAQADHVAAAREALEASYAAIDGRVPPQTGGVSWNQ